MTATKIYRNKQQALPSRTYKVLTVHNTTEHEHAYILHDSRLFEILWHISHTFQSKAFRF
jgi:hypothetical protein